MSASATARIGAGPALRSNDESTTRRRVREVAADELFAFAERDVDARRLPARHDLLAVAHDRTRRARRVASFDAVVVGDGRALRRGVEPRLRGAVPVAAVAAVAAIAAFARGPIGCRSLAGCALAGRSLACGPLARGARETGARELALRAAPAAATPAAAPPASSLALRGSAAPGCERGARIG